MLAGLTDIIGLLLERGLTTPSRIYYGLEILRNNGVIKYRVKGDTVEGFVVGDSGLVHHVVVSSDGYKCTCGDYYTSRYMCKHVIALLVRVSRENNLDIEWIKGLRKTPIGHKKTLLITLRHKNQA